MNVLHLDEQRGWRGGEQQASWLIRELIVRSHHVVVAGRHESAFVDDFEGVKGVECARLAFRGEADLFTARQLAMLIRGRGIDIIHAHTSHAHSMACLARWFAGQGRVVVSRRVSFVPRSDPINRWKYAKPDLYLAVSGSVRDVLLEYGLPPERVRLVYSSVNLDRVRPSFLAEGDQQQAATTRAGVGVSADDCMLFSAGALTGHKDHATLIAALPTVLSRFPRAKTIIAGEGSLRSALEKQIADLGLQQNVLLLGHRKDVPELVAAADLYVSSSFSEGLGTSVLEALASGTPVVAAVAGGVPEMVIDGKTGYLVPNRNAAALAEGIQISLSRRPEALEMARAGRRHVEDNFTVHRMVDGTLEAYEDLLRKETLRS